LEARVRVEALGYGCNCLDVELAAFASRPLIFFAVRGVARSGEWLRLPLNRAMPQTISPIIVSQENTDSAMDQRAPGVSGP
jgi:hypothetical protein